MMWRRLFGRTRGQHSSPNRFRSNDASFSSIQQSPLPCSTCPYHEQKHASLARCGRSIPKQHDNDMPSPTVLPTYSVRRRILNAQTAIPLDSKDGRERLIRALSNDAAIMYVRLTQHSVNQSEPAYCGITTAVICLNALEVDSVFRWKGGWRYWYEEVLLTTCQCLTHVETNGITMDEFHRIMSCQTVSSTMHRAEDMAESEFRESVRTSCCSEWTILVVSFARHALGQTGDGHFSPIAAYDADTDSVLVLDVARYKYPYYWVTVADMYAAMRHGDVETGKSRGWFRLKATTPPKILEEERRPIHAAPLVDEDPHPCPMHPVKVTYCKNQRNDDER